MSHQPVTAEATLTEIVQALISTIGLKDSYTMGHGHRVQCYASQIGRALGLSEEEIRQIELAALLHDVGKIGVPEEILNKPSSLTSEEYDLIKKHPLYSKQIVEQISAFSDLVQLIYAHHENHNGTGYPLGLSYPEIPLGSQIIQVADAFDAMTSERPYRKPLSQEKVVEIMRAESNKQFNGELVDVFLTKVLPNVQHRSELFV